MANAEIPYMESVMNHLLCACVAMAMTTATAAQADTMFVSEGGGNKITEVTSTGTKITVGSALDFPWALGFDSAGNLYEADFNSGNVYKFAKDGSSFLPKTTFASGIPFPPPEARMPATSPPAQSPSSISSPSLSWL